MIKKLLLTVLFFSLLSSVVWAQDRLVTGTVTSGEDGSPVPGVNVLVQGTAKGASTDVEGKFSIQLAANENVLVFSFIGFKQAVLQVGAQTVVDVVLEPDITSLEEVVVVGYGTQREKDLTSAISTVKSDDITKTPTAQAMQSLQGRVAGVQIVSNGAPGASPTVRVRGIGTFQGGATPLYVVDGMFFSNIDFLNPSDIGTITILKDASASAIYGVRAANGVVLIETKAGKYNQSTELVYDGYYGVQVPQNVLKMSNAQQFVGYVNETGSAADIAFVENAMQRYGRSRVDPNIPDVNTDWYGEIMSPAPIQNHSLTFSGGNDKTRYSIGGSYFSQDGLLNDTRNEFQRVNFRVKLDTYVKDWLSVGGNFNVTTSQQYNGDNGAWFRAYFAVPILPVYDDQNTNATPYQLANAQQIGYRGNQNPFYSLLYVDDRNNVGKVMGNLFVNLDLIPDKLSFKTSYNYSLEQINNRRMDFAYNDGVTNVQSAMRRQHFSGYDQVWDNVLTYNDVFGKHRLTVVGGQSFRSEYAELLFVRGQNISPTPTRDNEHLWYLSRALSYDVNGIGDSNDDTIYGNLFFLSYFTRLAYNYDDRYLVYGTFRRDGNNKFQKTWQNYSTIGGGWVVSSESFFQVDAINFLKLRGSWGQLGNDAISPAVGSPTLEEVSTSIDGVRLTGRRLNPVYDYINQPEVTVEKNFGISARFLRDRLSLEADYYIRDTRKLAVNITPPVFRGGTQRRGVGEIQNKGLELTLGWSDNITDDLSYSIGGNIATLSNTVKSLGGAEYLDAGTAEFRQRSIVGDPFQAFFGYEVEGVFQNQSQIENSGYTAEFITTTNLVPGDFFYKDQNDDGIINDKDRVVLGTYIPKVSYGFNLGVTYKNFDLTALFQGQANYKILNRKRGEIIFTNDTNLDAELVDNLWRGEGTSNRYPSAAGLRKGWNQRMSSYFVEDGSYFRIQNVRLSYSIKGKQVGKVPVPETRITFTAERPLTIFDYNGFTPEVADGIDRQVYPIPAIYTLGLNVKL